MSNICMMLREAALVTAFLLTGISVSAVAHASPLPVTVQAGTSDPRADVKIDSKIMVERTVVSASGESKTQLVTPGSVKVIPGDKLVFINAYSNSGSKTVTGFVVNNPVHKAVALIEVIEDWALVSVDDGKTFGKLADLSVIDSTPAEDESAAAAAPGPRAAVAADVTHIRWVLPSAIAPGASGELRFRAVVN